MGTSIHENLHISQPDTCRRIFRRTMLDAWLDPALIEGPMQLQDNDDTDVCVCDNRVSHASKGLILMEKMIIFIPH